MTTKDELHELIDEFDEDSARQALKLLQDLRPRREPHLTPIDTADDLEFTELPKHPSLEVQEPED
jgi:hypothetical protein